MTAYVVGHMYAISTNEGVAAYLSEIDATLAPFGGRFVIHGGETEVVEGEWPGVAIVIAFRDRAAAHGWYQSPAYQAILPLRLNNTKSNVVLVDGVEEDHKATDVLGP